MHVHRVFFERHAATADGAAESEAIDRLLGTWRRNGQVCGGEWPIAPEAHGYSVHVLTPEPDSLEARWNRRYVTEALAHVANVGLAMRVEAKGKDQASADACECPSPSAFVLFTTFVSLESSVRCLDCDRPVALHRFEPANGDEHADLIGWQSDYQSCDRLQMNCTVLERAATREMSAIDSALSRSGRALCDALAASSGRPFYYYLYRNGGRSRRAEAEGPCPGCGGDWKLAERLHLFDFKCDRCRLLSNVSFSMR
jgi:predicted  nucleic acid-binding Zn ribbon protein